MRYHNTWQLIAEFCLVWLLAACDRGAYTSQPTLAPTSTSAAILTPTPEPTPTDTPIVTSPTIEIVPTPSYSPVIALSAGFRHSLALRQDGTVWAWGTSYHGAIDNGRNNNDGRGSTKPIWISALSNVEAVFAGGDLSMALTNNKELWVWGANTHGELGNGAREDQLSPIRIDLESIVQVDPRYGRTLAVTSDGSVWAWGSNPFANLENQPDELLKPTLIEGLTDIKAVSAGDAHNLALTSKGFIYAWGLGDCGGCIGNGADSAQLSPILLDNLSGITMIATGMSYSLALSNDGTVWEWGAGKSMIPVLVSNLSDVIAIGGGSFHRVALRSDGTVWTWGENSHGQLGYGTTDRDRHPIPTQVPGLTDVVLISPGQFYTLALKSDGSIWAWGENSFGQLGDGTTELRASPVEVHVVGAP
jgi:alpha-tubulin suppressor-like RCC1 family protein